MSQDDPKGGGPPGLPLLQRREIEARIVGPLVRAFADEFGSGPTLSVLRRVIEGLARDAGADLARSLGEASLPAFAGALYAWKQGGALEIQILAQDDGRLDFNVTRCKYAEMYRALGLADLGGSLSCVRDYALIEGFNPDVALTRTQTIMDGAPFCDFRFRRSGGDRPLKSPAPDDDPVD